MITKSEREQTAYEMAICHHSIAYAMNELLNKLIDSDPNPPFGNPAYALREMVAKERDQAWEMFRGSAVTYIKAVASLPDSEGRWVSFDKD